jgi:hypothetical protein
MTSHDLTISGNTCSIKCWTSRWDVQNYSIIVETWIKKSDLQSLRSSVTPGAVGELYNILGKPLYYDQTWSAENTLQLIPKAGERLDKMRNIDKLIYVKNITDVPLPGDSRWLNVKIEGFMSGSGDL